MRVDVRVDAKAVQAQLRQARLAVDRQAREALAAAANRIAVPQVRVLAPDVISQYLVAKSTNRGPYITTAGPRIKDRIAGLLNLGGTVKTPIFPAHGRAVMTPAGPRAVAWRGADVPGGGTRGKAAKYEGKYFIQKGIERVLPRMADAAADEIVAAFSRG